MHNRTLAQTIHDLSSFQYSSVELVSHYLDRIAQINPTLNSVVTVCEASALNSAKAADAALKAGNCPPLTGIPILHKDIFCTQGVKTACGSKMLDAFIAPYDATVVSALQAQGAITVGKTNMDEFAMGSSNETSFYGPAHNPWNTEYVPGGSSGGSAAAVAARLAPAATGTDTGGSIRQPAALCGITGLKPTYGRVSRYGMIAFASSLDQAGPMTQTAEDAAILLNAMAGHDPKDTTSSQEPTTDYTAELNTPINGLRIGLPKAFFDAGLNPETKQAIEEALRVYETLGATLHEIELPHNTLSVPAYYIIAPAECSSNLARFDGVRYGYRCSNPTDLEDLYTRSRGEGFGQEVKRRILVGTYALSAGYYDAYYIKAQKIRHIIRQDFHNAFDHVDVIMGPTSPTPAFKLGERTADPLAMYLSDIYTIAVNLAGLPALSLPAGFVRGLPVGLQLIGKAFDEANLLRIAHAYQQATAWHTHIPADYR